jgi:hypothetical protein
MKPILIIMLVMTGSILQAQDTLLTKNSKEYIGTYGGYSFGYVQFTDIDSASHIIDPKTIASLKLANGIIYDRFKVMQGEMYLSNSTNKVKANEALTTTQLIEKGNSNVRASGTLLGAGMALSIIGFATGGDGGTYLVGGGSLMLIGSSIALISAVSNNNQALERLVHEKDFP